MEKSGNLRLKPLIVGALANVFEWYDYALFIHFAPLIGEQFFQGSGLLTAFMIFAAGFFMRPLGGIFFGLIGDKFGRSKALGSAMMCMAIPTLIVGLTPTYQEIGVTASVIMVLARLLQGFSMGGAAGGVMTFVIEHSPKKYRGLAGGIQACGLCCGILLGSLVVSITHKYLTQEQFLTWGWRVPFLLGIVVLPIGFYIKKRMAETTRFESMHKAGQLPSNPLKLFWQDHRYDLIKSICIHYHGGILFNVLTVYLLHVNSGMFDQKYFFTGCYVILAIGAIISGAFSDKVGRRRFLAITTVCSLCTLPLLLNIIKDSPNVAEVLLAQIILAIIVASYLGVQSSLQAEFYPSNVRFTALALVFNISNTLAAFIPYMAERFLGLGGLSWYLTGSALICMTGLYFYQDRSLLENQESPMALPAN